LTNESRFGSRERPQSYESLVVALHCETPAAVGGAGPFARSLLGLQTLVVGRADRPGERPADSDDAVHLQVQDARLSGKHFRLERVAGSAFRLRDLGSRNGTLVNGKPCSEAALTDGDVIEAGRTVFVFRSAPGTGPRADLFRLEGDPSLASFEPSMQNVLAAVHQLALSRVPLLIQGDTGTGKELVARAIHRLSRRAGPFVAVNCGALPPTLVESELFGYRRGAFSGATEDRTGLVRSADGGTLFLDEIGDLPTSAHAAMLRVLQENEVMPIGASKPLPIDLRIVTATHRPLLDMVKQEKFREDLYARLAGATLRLPALRARREDIGLIVATLLERLLGERARELVIASAAARALFLYSWPRNVRELDRALESALAMRGGNRIELDDLPELVRAALGGSGAGDEASTPRAELASLLTKHGWNVSAVARAMGKGRTQIQRWMKRYGLRPPDKD
jgi:transcriptional regulator of acetoin/glycerol metabolism